jgi:hypothetical protein
MAKTKYYYSALDEQSMPMATGLNSATRKECIEAIFDFWSSTADEDDMEVNKPFEDFTFKEKEEYMTSIYEIEEHTEKYPDEDAEEEDEETTQFKQDYGSSFTLTEMGTRYGGNRAIY